MDLLTLASSLWLQTHTLKLQDLELIRAYQLDSEKDWVNILSNESLKQYLLNKPNWFEQAKKDIALLEAKRIRYLHYFSDGYPDRFLTIDTPPLFFTYIGSLQPLQSTCLTVVGTRDPSLDACVWIETYLQDVLRKHNITTVSGAAIGVDQMSHSLAVFCKRSTIAILPSGLGSIYPQNFERQIEHVLGTGGAVLSEYPYEQFMRKHHFYQRNRLLASLGQALLVVEAKRKSGSLITARYALDMGRDVLVLPSSPFEENKLGTLDLLYDGALPVRDDLDLIGYLGPYFAKSKKGYGHKQDIGGP